MAEKTFATQIVDDLDDAEIKKFVTEKLNSHLKRNPKPSGRWDRLVPCPYYTFGTDEVGYLVLVDDETDKIIYFVRHKRVKANGVHLGRQVLVWRDPLSAASRGFAEYIFFNHLLPKYTSLISDQHQTRNGAAFWQKMLELAFKKRKNVYFLDRRATPNTLTHLKSMFEIHELTPDLWGRSEGHKRTFSIISQSRLQLIPKS